MASGIRIGAISFTGDFTSGGPRAQDFLMSRPFTERPIKFVARFADAPFDDPSSRDPPRVAFLRNSTAHLLVMPYLRKRYGDNLSVTMLDDRARVADMLRRGELDAFITDGARAEIFAKEPDVAVNVFRPLMYKRISIATAGAELAPIINVLNRIFSDRKAMAYVHELHRRGEIRFYRKVFLESLSESERGYYEKRLQSGIPIPIGASPTNYPV